MADLDDLVADEAIADPHAFFAQLRETDPVHWNARHALWVITRHADVITLVPERREEITTERGLNLEADTPRLRESIQRLADAGCRVSLFIDPDPATLARARDLGVPAVELHTGHYAHTWQSDRRALDELARAAGLGREMGLAVHAGHGLTYHNVQAVARIAEIEELNIGHSVISRSIFEGIDAAVREMLGLVHSA